MRRLFDHQDQQMTRCSRHVLITALLVLLSPMAVWAHDCGPRTLTVWKGTPIVYSITGRHGHSVLRYEIVDQGDPRVAKIEPPAKIDQSDLDFKITGTGKGTTVFKIYWQGPQRQSTCHVKVTVAAE